MTTEITSQLPPCPLPDCEGGESYGPVTRSDIFHGRWFEHEPKPIIPSAPVLDREPVAITEDDVMGCRFRMLEPHEIAVGMAFPRDYRWRGTKRERVRLAGNAVTPPAARDLITVLAESLEVTA